MQGFIYPAEWCGLKCGLECSWFLSIWVDDKSVRLIIVGLDGMSSSWGRRYLYAYIPLEFGRVPIVPIGLDLSAVSEIVNVT